MVQPGSSVAIDVMISGLGAATAPSAGSFDLTLEFDTSFFTYNSTSFGTELGDEAAAEAIIGTTPMTGNIQAFEVSLLTPATLNASQPASFVLLTLTFDSTGIPGEATFPAATGLLSDENGAPLTFTSNGTQVTTGTVLDIPTLGEWSLLLFALVLLSVGVLALRRAG